jgi:predicted SprT family Zn-dependent metalloprotease
MLTTLPPFDDWDWPPDHHIEFVVTDRKDYYGSYSKYGKQHVMRISRYNVKSVPCLVRTVAHEMIHLGRTHMKKHGRKHHGRDFQYWGYKVCSLMVFDPSEF